MKVTIEYELDQRELEALEYCNKQSDTSISLQVGCEAIFHMAMAQWTHTTLARKYRQEKRDSVIEKQMTIAKQIGLI